MGGDETKKAVIIGAGPAGLTAAWELLARTPVRPVVLEGDAVVGGISRTAVHRGNRIDIGGHRFFSKSARVRQWWAAQMPVQPGDGPPAGPGDEPVMLVRRRLSRILHRRKFFDYPLSLGWATLRKLGIGETLLVGASFLKAALFPRRPERSLEAFFVNRFGARLYRTFFQAYTEKVWGVPCAEIPADWGAQRIKGLSVAAVVRHALARALSPRPLDPGKGETSLIERFLYPKRGPGQLWETVAGRVAARGGEIRLGHRVVSLRHAGGRIVSAVARVRDGDADGAGRTVEEAGDLFVSTMPVRDLVLALDPPAPEPVRALAARLRYRDFLTVGLLLRRVVVHGVEADGTTLGAVLPDNWIYVQEPHVQVGRIQVFNNWSPYLVADPRTVWLGLEYFADEGDALWSLPDAALADLARREMAQLGFCRPDDCLDAVVLRMPKAYPSYFGEGYARFDELRAYLDGFANLRLLGRNGMHRYNNQDHSMLTAMVMVDDLVAGRPGTANLWAVNVEREYHETSREKAA